MGNITLEQAAQWCGGRVEEKYREVLSKNRGFYEKLAELQPSLKWRGCRIFVPSK